MTNEPAFPRPMSIVNGVCLIGQDGMSLRDYFAAKAMQAIFVNSMALVKCGNDAGLATHSYSIADAMIAERQKGQP